MIRKLFWVLLSLTTFLYCVTCGTNEQADGEASSWRFVNHSKEPIKFDHHYYASLWWHGYRQLGLFEDSLNTAYAPVLHQLSPLLAEFDAPAPLLGVTLNKFLYQFPSYLNPRNPEELKKIMRVSKQFVREGSIAVFMDEWPRETRYWDQWYCDPAVKLLLEPLTGKEETLFRIMDIWEEYMKTLWPKYQKTYYQELESYPFKRHQAMCDTLELFEFWEDQFELTYPYAKFDIVVCPSCPSLVSRIGPEKIVVGAKYPWGILVNAIVHEVGYRYPSLYHLAQSPDVHEIMTKDFAGISRLIEAEVCVRKGFKLEHLTGDAYVTSLNMQGLVNLVAISLMDTTVEAYLPIFYQRAKEAELL